MVGLTAEGRIDQRTLGPLRMARCGSAPRKRRAHQMDRHTVIGERIAEQRRGREDEGAERRQCITHTKARRGDPARREERPPSGVERAKCMHELALDLIANARIERRREPKPRELLFVSRDRSEIRHRIDDDDIGTDATEVRSQRRDRRLYRVDEHRSDPRAEPRTVGEQPGERLAPMLRGRRSSGGRSVDIGEAERLEDRADIASSVEGDTRASLTERLGGAEERMNVAALGEHDEEDVLHGAATSW